MRAGRMGIMHQRPGQLRLGNSTLFSHPGQRLDRIFFSYGTFYMMRSLIYFFQRRSFGSHLCEQRSRACQVTKIWNHKALTLRRSGYPTSGHLGTALTKLRGGYGTTSTHLQYNLQTELLTSGAHLQPWHNFCEWAPYCPPYDLNIVKAWVPYYLPTILT